MPTKTDTLKLYARIEEALTNIEKVLGPPKGIHEMLNVMNHQQALGNIMALAKEKNLSFEDAFWLYQRYWRLLNNLMEQAYKEKEVNNDD